MRQKLKWQSTQRVFTLFPSKMPRPSCCYFCTSFLIVSLLLLPSFPSSTFAGKVVVKRAVQEEVSVTSTSTDGNTQECRNDRLACNPFKRGDESCYDSHSSCHEWAKAGECEKNPNYMLFNCPLACEQCTAGCADLNRNCKHWAEEGECEINPGWMLENCPVSCQQCRNTDTNAEIDQVSHPSENIDAILGLEFGIMQSIEGSEETQARVRSVIREASDFMEYYSAALREGGISDTDALLHCYNTHRLCALWAADGECTRNSKYMKKNCGPVCKSCVLSPSPSGASAASKQN
jgi:hypothetical protein